MIARYARVTVSKCNKTNEYRVFDPPPLRRGLKTSLLVLVSGRSFAFSGEEEKKFVGESTASLAPPPTEFHSFKTDR